MTSFISMILVALLLASAEGGLKGDSSNNNGALSIQQQHRVLDRKTKKGTRDTEQFVLLQVAKTGSTTTLRPNNEPGIGDVYVWDRSNLLYRTNEIESIDDGTLYGSNEGHCTRLTNAGVDSNWECNFVLFLPDGQLHLQGPFNVTGMATTSVVGGTGSYVGTVGTLELGIIGTFEEYAVYQYTLDLSYEYRYH